MKYLGLLFNNVFRNRRRTFLTITSIAVSLFLVSTLMTMLYELENPLTTPQSALRLIARHRVSLANILPASYRLKIARVEGVDAVVGSMWFGGIYKDPKNFFAQFAIDTDQFFRIYSDLGLPEEQKQAFVNDRTGALAGANLARQYGWKVGDRITLQGALFDMSPELTIRGIYTGGSDDASTFYFHWDYFNEGMKQLYGTNSEAVNFTGFYVIQAKSADLVPSVAEKVDALFKNTAAPTKTESEKAFVLGFLAMMGNIRMLVTSICSVMMFTIVLVAANTMAMSIRERVREIGIMKALGFRRLHVLSLLLGESVFLALVGALIGSVGAKAAFAKARLAAYTGGMFQQLNVRLGTIAICALIGIAVGVISAGLPAWQAARRRVVEALRDVD